MNPGQQLIAVSMLGVLAASPAFSIAAQAQTPPGPDVRVKITAEYAKHVGRDAYFWAWPMMNIYNRRLALMRLDGARQANHLR